MNPKVDTFLSRATKWREEMTELRRIVLEGGLTEEIKWGKPCYTAHGANVVLIIPFVKYCALLFCQGALLSHASGLLITPGEHTQAARQVRFTSLHEVQEAAPVLKALLQEAIQAEKAGLKVAYSQSTELTLPAELEQKLTEAPDFRKAFMALTPGRQRAYAIYFSAPKQSKTRESRIAKCRPQILEGKGLHDNYRQKAGK